MNPYTGTEPHLVQAWAYWLDDDAEARKIIDNEDTFLADLFEDNGGPPDGSDWLIFALGPNITAEIERLGISGGLVSGYLLYGYTHEANLHKYADRWMGNQKLRMAFFTNEQDAERALRQLRAAQKDQP